MGKNPSIQCLRGIAALFVLFYHASAYSERQFGDAGGFASFFNGRFGLVGVAIFFAISGWLMADIIQRTDPWRFLAHRIVRIYPTYLLAITLSVPVIALLGVKHFGLHVLSLILAPAGQRSYYLAVEWTLVFECTYYVALFLIAAAGWHRHLNGLSLVWLGLIGAVPVVVSWDDDRAFYSFYSIWLSATNVAFAAGMLIPWFSSRLRIPAGAGFLATLAVLIIQPPSFVLARWAAGAAAALLVLDAVQMKLPQRALPGLPMMGDWSYALYLIHVPCILVTYHYVPAANAAWPCAVTASIAASAGFGMVDVWLYRHLKNAVDRLGDEESRRRVNIYVGVFITAALVGAVTA